MLLRTWAVTCRAVGAVTILGLGLVSFTPLPNVIGRRVAVAPDVGPADAIVVLGASVNRDGTLGDSSMRRALAGIKLYRHGLAPHLVFLGLYTEAGTRAHLAVDLGVKPSAILAEHDEPTTRDEAARMRVVLGQRLGLRTVLLVTDPVHMRRARALFERAGFTVRPAPTDDGLLAAGSHEERMRLCRAIGTELVALGYHKLFGYL
jgi:uncharacterized SAM-binding protein YcdF (DUF218 family)